MTALPRRIRRSEAVEKAEWTAARNLPKYIKKLHELAMGIYLVRPIKKTETPRTLILRDEVTGEEEVLGVGLVVYQAAPDARALEYITDRGMGKVPQRYEITGEDSGPVAILPWIPSKEAKRDYIEGTATEIPPENQLPAAPRVSAIPQDEPSSQAELHPPRAFTLSPSSDEQESTNEETT